MPSGPRVVFITRRAEFAAAHVLSNPEWTEEQNLRVYGGCAHPAGHGHNYALEVTLAGEIDPGTGMLINPNGTITWNLHYFPVGAEGEDDVVEGVQHGGEDDSSHRARHAQ